MFSDKSEDKKQEFRQKILSLDSFKVKTHFCSNLLTQDGNQFDYSITFFFSYFFVLFFGSKLAAIVKRYQHVIFSEQGNFLWVRRYSVHFQKDSR
jgi:hypothetical protein